MSSSEKIDVMQRLDKIWKAVGAVIGIAGLLLGASSWAFTYAMSDRDREFREMTKSVERLEERVEKLQDRLQVAEKRASDDMSDIRVALVAIRTRLEFGSPLDAVSQVGEREMVARRARHYRAQPGGARPSAPARVLGEDISHASTPAVSQALESQTAIDPETELDRELRRLRPQSSNSNPFLPRQGSEILNLNQALERISSRHPGTDPTATSPAITGQGGQ